MNKMGSDNEQKKL